MARQSVERGMLVGGLCIADYLLHICHKNPEALTDEQTALYHIVARRHMARTVSAAHVVPAVAVSCFAGTYVGSNSGILYQLLMGDS
jgi:hypothetical protein